MDTIKCARCGEEIEVSSALQGQIEAQVLEAADKRHEHQLAEVRRELERSANERTAAAHDMARKQIASERELLKQQSDTELEIERKRLQTDIQLRERQAQADQELLLRSLREETQSAKADSAKLRDKLSELMTELRDSNKARETAEFNANQRFAAEEAKLREDVMRTADERHRLNEAAKDKTIQDLQKAMDDMQRKAAQGSQQLQGEIMELDFEAALADAFRDDLIEPVAKGVRGGDIRQTVRSIRGTVCGVMLWEIKRTKNWTDGWTGKLKEDLRNEKANIPIIVTEALPKSATEDISMTDGVWVCRPQLAIVLGTLLRKSLVDVGRERAIGENRSSSAEALYGFVTSHEFVQQIEVMVETYQEMTAQVSKERIAYEKLWAQRDKQAQRLMMGTANIIGSMQGQIGAGSMPRIKGLDLLDVGPDDTPPRLL